MGGKFLFESFSVYRHAMLTGDLNRHLNRESIGIKEGESSLPRNIRDSIAGFDGSFLHSSDNFFEFTGSVGECFTKFILFTSDFLKNFIGILGN
jgi:hypothetical protein